VPVWQWTQVQALLRDRMSKPTRAIPPKLQAWIQARQRHHLSHAQVQMARELGMNPMKLGSIDNHRQEPWKAPLPEFIEHLYFNRFGRLAQNRLRSTATRRAPPSPDVGCHPPVTRASVRPR
jgi:hypothetical protein